MLQYKYQKAIKFAGEVHKAQLVHGSNSNYLLHISNVAMEILVAYQNNKDFDIDFAVQIEREVGVGVEIFPPRRADAVVKPSASRALAAWARVQIGPGGLGPNRSRKLKKYSASSYPHHIK